MGRDVYSIKTPSSQEISFYKKLLKTHGPCVQALGWKNDLAQKKRFEQLVKIIKEREGFSINDLGCGFGDLLDFLAKEFFDFSYCGYDVLEEMLELAVEKLTNYPNACFLHVKGAEDLKAADYTVAGGIFSLKYSIPEADWIEYIFSCMNFMNENSIKGFACNFLTSYSDSEYKKDYLFYADPLFFFDYCKKKFSKNVALLHDYNEYDFTILVRKESM